jgi:hypothetical protein
LSEIASLLTNTLNLVALNKLFHLTSRLGDVLFQQLAGSLCVTLTAKFEQRAMFIFGVAMRIARKQNVQPDIEVVVSDRPVSAARFTGLSVSRSVPPVTAAPSPGAIFWPARFARFCRELFGFNRRKGRVVYRYFLAFADVPQGIVIFSRATSVRLFRMIQIPAHRHAVKIGRAVVSGAVLDAKCFKHTLGE